VDTDLPAGRRLLVVDDERVQRMIVSRAVEPLGFLTDTAATLAEAADMLAAHNYDAVVLDLSLGDSEGITLLQSLRGPAMDPVVVFISHLDERVRGASARLAAALGLRVAGALQKPVPPAALRAMLRDVPARAHNTGLPQHSVPTAGELDEALRNGEVTTEFQPKISLSDGRVVGMEALARWLPHTKEAVPPDSFIPLAELGGLIVPLTFAILRDALAACRRWRVRHPICSVAVNVSPLVLANPALPEDIERLLQANDLGPGALIAEITEGRMIANPLIAAEVLTRLRIKGISLSIDDFGTGHSSLVSLHRLPFSELKIDRSFVTHCDTDPDAWKIVRATISMARELGLTVVAEGIESEPVAQLLREAGCEVGQGWYFGHAMPEATLTDWLAARCAA